MTQAKANKERDIEDFDVPLHERGDFREWAEKVILPSIRRAPVTTVQIRKRVGAGMGTERQFTLQMALDYLLLHRHIFPVQKHVTLYTTKAPKDPVRRVPKIDWNGDVLPKKTQPRVTPHFQQMGKKELA